MKIIFPALIVLIFLTGCCNIEYKGTELPPLKSEQNVILYFSAEQYPKHSVQEVLGTAKASAGTNWTAQQVQAKLKNFAASKGANGLLIERIERIPAGEARPDQVKNLPAKNWGVGDSSGNAVQTFRDDMTSYSKKTETPEELYRIVIHAKLLKISGRK